MIFLPWNWLKVFTGSEQPPTTEKGRRLFFRLVDGAVQLCSRANGDVTVHGGEGGAALGVISEEEITAGTATTARAINAARLKFLRDAIVAALVDTSPGTLDTLNELAAALGDDPDFATTVLNALAGKAPNNHNHSGVYAELTDGKVGSSVLPAPSIDALGGVKRNTGSAGQFVTGIDEAGNLTHDTPAGQSLTNFTESLNSTSPNNTITAAVLAATGAATHIDCVIRPKGSSGALILGAAPDGTATGGNKRGTGAVDLQQFRTASTRVASGANAFIGGGQQNTASGIDSACFNASGIASGTSSFVAGGAAGQGSQATGVCSIALGNFHLVSGNGAAAIGGNGNYAPGARSIASGLYSNSRYDGCRAHASGSFGNTIGAGSAQAIERVAYTVTTGTTPEELRHGSSSNLRISIASGFAFSGEVIIKGLRNDGSVGARFRRFVDIKNVAGTTSLETAVEQIGTDYNPSSCSVSLTADDTNDALAITCTGAAGETWRWGAVIYGIEMAYGT